MVVGERDLYTSPSVKSLNCNFLRLLHFNCLTRICAAGFFQFQVPTDVHRRFRARRQNAHAVGVASGRFFPHTMKLFQRVLAQSAKLE
jgi:hypothetical protein